MKPASESCEECDRWKEIRQRFNIANLLSGLMGNFEARIEAKELKPTVAEYLKLMQIEQEIEQESPKEIKVTWVEPETISSVEESK
jgi:hypothetical protein